MPLTMTNLTEGDVQAILQRIASRQSVAAPPHVEVVVDSLRPHPDPVVQRRIEAARELRVQQRDSFRERHPEWELSPEEVFHCMIRDYWYILGVGLTGERGAGSAHITYRTPWPPSRNRPFGPMPERQVLCGTPNPVIAPRAWWGTLNFLECDECVKLLRQEMSLHVTRV